MRAGAGGVHSPGDAAMRKTRSFVRGELDLPPRRRVAVSIRVAALRRRCRVAVSALLLARETERELFGALAGL